MSLLFVVVALLGLFAVIGALFWITSLFYLGSQLYHQDYLDFDLDD